MKRMLLAGVATTFLALAGCNMMPGGSGSDGTASTAPTEGVTDAMIAAPPAEEWLSYGRDYTEQRFSPLEAVNASNVGQLGLAWSADMDTARGQEATPVMHDGVLYVSTAWSMVKAFDAATGKPLWSYDPKVPRTTLVRTCCDSVNRGVALYGTNLYVATLDGRLVALDAKTGAKQWEKTVVPDQQSYTITGAPRAAKGLILIGGAGAEYRARGYLAAFDWKTGNEVWRFHTVPDDPSKGSQSKAMDDAAKTWSGKWWTMGGGGTVWDSVVYDPKTDLILFGTGNAEPWNPAPMGRQGDSLYTSSVVAVKASTGEYAWHFQETPEDRWDYDSDAPITLADIEVNGQMRHVAMHAPKNGYFYILDAKTGEFLGAKPFAAQTWTTGVDPKSGRPAINPAALYDKTGKPFLGMPGAIGAHSWQPQSFSPKTGLVYLPTNVVANPFLGEKGWQPSQIGFQNAMDMASGALPADKAIRAGALKATTGALVAWDPKAGKAAWSASFDGGWSGGTLATAGNLVFQGNPDGNLYAYSADRGAKLWSFPVQTGAIAAPMTYSINGEQYVAILAGWGGVWDIVTGVIAHKSPGSRNISRLLVFKLGAKGTLPPAPALAKLPLDPPPVTGTPQQIAHGGALYGRYCSVCHGDAAVAGSINPDLRHTGVLNNPAGFKAIVIDGALSKTEDGGKGMVSFASALKPEDVEDIRHYLIKRANEDKALEGK